MKTKLLSLFIFILITNIAKSQTEINDYASGMTDPTYISISGTDMYVLGSQNIYRVDTTANNPTPAVIYTVPNDFFLVNFTINGNLIYIALENYIQSTDTFLGGRIVSLDLNNIAQPASDIYSTAEYISSITNNGSTIYLAAETLLNPPDFEPFTTHLDVIDASISNPTAQTIVSNLNNSSVIRGMLFDNNQVYMSSSDDNSVFIIDVTQINQPVITEIDNLNFNRGIFKSGNELYLANGSLINKIDLTNPSAGLTALAINTTYEDTNNGMPFFANFRDVILVGNTMYMTLRDQGRVVQAIDNTLSIENFNSSANDFTVYNSTNELSIQGLTSQYLKTTIYDLSGKNLFNKELNINDNTINISSLSSGIYLLNIDNKKTLKFVR